MFQQPVPLLELEMLLTKFASIGCKTVFPALKVIFRILWPFLKRSTLECEGYFAPTTTESYTTPVTSDFCDLDMALYIIIAVSITFNIAQLGCNIQLYVRGTIFGVRVGYII